jgi:hypothetical protein
MAVTLRLLGLAVALAILAIAQVGLFWCNLQSSQHCDAEVRPDLFDVIPCSFCAGLIVEGEASRAIDPARRTRSKSSGLPHEV